MYRQHLKSENEIRLMKKINKTNLYVRTYKKNLNKMYSSKRIMLVFKRLQINLVAGPMPALYQNAFCRFERVRCKK